MSDAPTLKPFCHACQAIPAHGWCKLAGCPTAPDTQGLPTMTLTPEARERLEAAVGPECAREIQIATDIRAALARVKELEAGLEPFALLAPSDQSKGVNMGDPLSKWFTIAQ